MRQFLKSNSLLLAVLGLAFIFRFWQIGDLPGGLFPDEAANGLDVNSILEGDFRPFYERGNGREALFFYFLALAVSIFGRGPWQHHIVSAGFGFFEVLATYFLAKRMFGKNVALLAAFFMAASSYAVTLSRTAFRANTVPLFTTLTILFLVKFFQERDKKTKLWSATAAGACLALGFYTYISFRMMIPLLLVLGTVLLYANRGKLYPVRNFISNGVKSLLGQYRAYAIGVALSFLLFFAPLGRYFITHPGTFIGRAGQVSIFSEDLNQGDVVGTFLQVFQKTMLSFFTEGDQNWRHNVAGYPFLSPLLSAFFGAGLLIFTLAWLALLKQAARRKIHPQVFYLSLCALWFWLMLVPEVATAEGIPHGLRLVGVIPVIFIISAWCIRQFWERFKGPGALMQNSKLAYAAIFLTAVFFYNFSLYFGTAASSPEYYYAFRSDLTVVSKYLNKRYAQSSTFLSLDRFSVQTVDYLTTETQNPYLLLDPARTYEVELKTGDQVIFTQSTLFDRMKFLENHPDAKLVKTERNQFGQIVMLVYEKP